MIGRVLRLAGEVYRHHARRVFQGVLVFLLLPALLQSFLYEWFIRGEDASRPIVALVGGLLALISSIGIVMFAGFLDVVIDHHTRGQTPGQLTTVAVRLPILQLLIANVVLSAAIAGGLALFVVPGVVIATWYCLVGPMLVSGGATSVLDGFRRAHALERGHFWLVFVLVPVPIAFEHWFVHAVDVALVDAAVVVALAAGLAVLLTVNATVGLVEVSLASVLRDEGS